MMHPYLVEHLAAEHRRAMLTLGARRESVRMAKRAAAEATVFPGEGAVWPGDTAVLLHAMLARSAPTPARAAVGSAVGPAVGPAARRDLQPAGSMTASEPTTTVLGRLPAVVHLLSVGRLRRRFGRAERVDRIISADATATSVTTAPATYAS
jgi:hypothetical protein